MFRRRPFTRRWFEKLVAATPAELRRETELQIVSERAMSPFEMIYRRQTTLPVDVIGLAADLGFEVREQNLGAAIAWLVRGERPMKLLISATMPEHRKRFVIAHMLSHHILHSDMFGAALIEDGAHNNGVLAPEYETQAHRLATAILMPKTRLMQLHEQGATVGELATRFDVRPAMIEILLGIKRQAS